MKAYLTLKVMIRYKKKSNEELLAYCDAYLKSGKITQMQYEELVTMIG